MDVLVVTLLKYSLIDGAARRTVLLKCGKVIASAKVFKLARSSGELEYCSRLNLLLTCC